MIYDLSTPIYNNGPQFPGQRPPIVNLAQLAVVKGATVEHLELMTHSATHIDAPLHFFPEKAALDQLPMSHFIGRCIAIDLRPLEPGHGITSSDLRRGDSDIHEDDIVLLKTGWGDKRANTKEFLTEWPYMTGDGASYLVNKGVKGVGIEGLSMGGYNNPEKERASHLELLGHDKLIIEDLCIPDAMLDGKHRFFAALPILIAGAGGAWARAIAWDAGDLENIQQTKEHKARVPAHAGTGAQPERLQ